MIILPSKYDSLELSKYEKILINSMKNKLDDTYIGILKINFTGIKDNEMNVFLNNKGALFLKEINFPTAKALNIMLNTLYIPQFKRTEEILISKLSEYKFLKNSNETLKFPLNIVYYFTEIDRSALDMDTYENGIITFINEHCIFKEDIKELRKEPINFLDKYIKERSLVKYEMNKDGLSENEVDFIIQRISPQYIIVRMSALEENENLTDTTNESYLIKDSDKYSNILRLDDTQINLINKINKGNQLILACAGSGKSVLLISKCFKSASINPDKKFLITCFNKNLNNYYDWQIDIAGFREKNVKCETFHSLCKGFLDKYNIPYDIEDYEQIFNKAQQAFNDGIIKERYYGIFIDEIQIFKKEWYKFCYALLENKKSEDHIFVISGDKSQNINNNIKAGRAPWQCGDDMPKYTGRSIRIERNYRNTKVVNRYINNVVDRSKKYFDKFGLNIEEYEDLYLRGIPVRDGGEVKVIRTKNLPDEVGQIIDSIEYFTDKKDIAHSDIAILMFNKSYGSHYPIQYAIETQLKEKEIIYSKLFDESSRRNKRVSYANRKGISLITFQGSLGLDYKAVILCGLDYMGDYCKSSRISHFNEVDEELLEKRKLDLMININSLYTACTRAREYLHIVLSDASKSKIYYKILVGARDDLICEESHKEGVN